MEVTAHELLGRGVRHAPALQMAHLHTTTFLGALQIMDIQRVSWLPSLTAAGGKIFFPPCTIERKSQCMRSGISTFHLLETCALGFQGSSKNEKAYIEELSQTIPFLENECGHSLSLGLLCHSLYCTLYSRSSSGSSLNYAVCNCDEATSAFKL